MTRTFAIPVAVAFAASILAISTPAYATDARAAIRLCDKNPHCVYDVNDDGSVDIDVIQVDGSYDWVHCSKSGQCVCKTCKTAGPGVSGANIVLRDLQGQKVN